MKRHTSTPARAAHLAGASIAMIAALLLAGCGTSAPEESEPTTSDPAAPEVVDESLAAVRDCMLDAGWEVRIVEQSDGFQGLEGTFPDDQQSQYDAALTGCQASNGGGEDAPGMTGDEASKYFDSLTETAQCLEREGFDIPAAPSRQSFIDAATRGEFIWNPHEALFSDEDLDVDKITRANELCPLPTS